MKSDRAPRSWRPLVPLAVGVAVAIGVAVAAAAGAPRTPGSEPWISMHETLRAMQNGITHVNAMIDRGVRGLSPNAAGDWLDRCCANNVVTIKEGSAELRGDLDYLEAQYAKRSDLDAIRTLQEMRRHITDVETVFMSLRKSAGPQDAKSRLQAIIHPFNHVRRSAFELESCCPVDPPPAPPADSGQ